MIRGVHYCHECGRCGNRYVCFGECNEPHEAPCVNCLALEAVNTVDLQGLDDLE